MSILTRLLPENPVLTKEMRVRMRGARAYWILLGYLGFLTTVLLWTYWNWRHDVDITGTGASESSETGKNIYMILLLCQAFLVLFITPAITSGSITIEKEQQTLDMLTMTRLSRAGMVAGKLISAVSFTALLLISSLPLVSICFMLGGVDPAMVVSTYVAMLMGSFLIGAVGLMWSSIAKTTTVAVLLTYLTMLGFTVVMAYVIGLYMTMKASPMMMGSGGAVGYAIVSIIQTWCSPGLFGGQGFEYVGFSVFSLLTGILLAAIAMARLETWPDRRAGVLRGLTAGIILLQVVSCYVWWLNRLYGAQFGGANAPAVGALMVPLFLLMVIVPTFATGEIYSIEARRFAKYLIWGWTPKGLIRGRLASGTPFLIILTVLCIGAYALTFVCFGKVRDLMHSAALPGVLVTAPAPPAGPGPVASPGTAPALPSGYTGTIPTNGTTMVYRNGRVVSVNGQPVAVPPVAAPAPPPPAQAHTGIWDTPGDFPQAIIVMLTFVTGFALLCQFLSIAFNNRWVAWTIAYMALFIVLILPAISAIMIDTGNPWITINFAYFNPFFSFVEMTEAGSTTFSSWATQHLVLGGVPMWLTTSMLWTIIGCVSFLATLPFVARRAMTSKAIPYEEMVISV